MKSLIERDLNHIFHPCSQMKDYEKFPPIEITKAQGSVLTTRDGSQIIDAISSWWCKSLGHGHPAIRLAIENQLGHFEHIIHANTTFEPLVSLSEKLTQLNPACDKVFYAGDGSCAVEIAMKLALHGKQLLGQSEKKEFIALSNSYHGETLATLAVSDLGIYKQPYEGLSVTCHFLSSLPYVSNENSPLWSDCSEYWPQIESQLEAHKKNCCAIIIEPLLQGAGGMLVYSADLLKRLANWAKSNQIYLIADEILTGIGRTGKMLACDHSEVSPDIICLSKGLTSGALPLSAVLLSDEIYHLFYDDYDKGKSFLHSHTYSGNPLAICAALAVMNEFEQHNYCEQAVQLGSKMLDEMCNIAELSGKLSNIRQLGAMVAADLVTNNKPRIGYELFQRAIKNGAWLRPLGNTLYWMPPLNTDFTIVEQLAKITYTSIQQSYA